MACTLTTDSERANTVVSQDEHSLEALLQALDSADWDVRIGASNALTALGDQAHTALIQEVRHGSVRRAVNAARVLSTQRTPAIYETMVGLIASRNPLLGQIAVEYVARNPDSAAILLDALNDSTYLVRISIVQALGGVGPADAVLPQVVDHLMLLLANPDVGITLRLTLISTLGLLGDPRAIPALESLLGGSDEHLNKRIRRSLDQLLHPDEAEEREN